MGHYDDYYIHEEEDREKRKLESLKAKLLQTIINITNSSDAQAALIALENRHTLTSLAKLLDDLKID